MSINSPFEPDTTIPLTHPAAHRGDVPPEPEPTSAVRCVLCAPRTERQARDGGVTCVGCHDRLAGWLASLGRDYPRLDAMPTAAGLLGGRRAPGFRSCPPLDLHRASMRDPRTAPDPVTGRGQSPANFVITWARWIREQRNQRPAALSFDTDAVFQAELNYLWASLDWITRQSWVVTFAAQLRPVRRTLRGTVTGERAPRPYATCTCLLPDQAEPDQEPPVCGHPLFPPRPGANLVVCGGCAAVYSPLAALLAQAAEAKAAEMSEPPT